VNAQPWAVYRDGLRYSVQACDVLEAFELARYTPRGRSCAEIMCDVPVVLYLREGVTVERAECPSVPAACEALTLSSQKFRVAALHEIKPCTLVVSWHEPGEPGVCAAALHVALACVRRLKAARNVQAQRVAVALFKSGKREGLPRFTRAHDEAFRARVSESIGANAARAHGIEVAAACVWGSLACLSLWRYLPVDSLGLAELTELRSTLERLERETRWGAPNGAHAWIKQAEVDVLRAQLRAQSVRDRGYPSGARCVLAKSEYGHEHHGPGLVTGVDVSASQARIGPDVVQHERLVQLDGGAEVWCQVGQLSDGATGAEK